MSKSPFLYDGNARRDIQAVRDSFDKILELKEIYPDFRVCQIIANLMSANNIPTDMLYYVEDHAFFSMVNALASKGMLFPPSSDLTH